MTEEEKADQLRAHETSCVLEGPPAEIDAGSEIALRISVSCPEECNLQGNNVRIADGEGAVVKEIELVLFDGTVNETDEFVVEAPTKLGEYTWTAEFPAQVRQGTLHEESSASFSFISKPHTTSMAVWDIPCAIVFNDKFKLKVGVRCSAECRLTDKEIEIYDHEGAKVATGSLGDVPWSDTTALYWAEIELEAPGAEGCYTWTVEFPKPDLEPPHEGAAYTFAFRTTRPPDHVVTVEVIDKETKAPIKNAQVTLHSCGTTYRNHTDDAGVTRVSVLKGKCALFVFKSDYKHFQSTIEVAGDATVKVELYFWPEVY